MAESPVERTVLITGANTGIGAAVVRALARQRARIGLHYLDSPPPSREGSLIIGSAVHALRSDLVQVDWLWRTD